MAEDRRGRGCGWLLLIAGIVALTVGTLAWLIGSGLRGGDRRRDVMVWVTTSGAHYHRRDCPALSRSTPSEMALVEAQGEGLTPCELCGPPT
ncbi:MAG: hypothetical protein ACOCZ7_01110 [Armatimonadota bacterium]